MADEDVVVGEVESDPIQTNSERIGDFLKAVQDQNFTSAEAQFNDMIGDRLQDQLDAAKVKIASALYDDEDTEELEDGEEEIDLEEPEDEVELSDDEQDAWDDDVAGV